MVVARKSNAGGRRERPQKRRQVFKTVAGAAKEKQNLKSFLGALKFHQLKKHLARVVIKRIVETKHPAYPAGLEDVTNSEAGESTAGDQFAEWDNNTDSEASGSR